VVKRWYEVVTRHDVETWGLGMWFDGMIDMMLTLVELEALKGMW
jgi:hypothetical protein